MITQEPDVRPEEVPIQALLESAYLLRQDDPKKALDIAHQALQYPETHLHGQLWLMIGQIYYQQASLDKALESLTHAYQTLEKHQSILALEALLSLGRVRRELGHFEDAEHTLLQALEKSQESNDTSLEIDAMNLLASIYDVQGRTAHALRLLKDSLTLAQQQQQKEQMANILTNMGNLYISLGDHTKALNCLYEANRFIQETTPNSRNEAVNLIRLGHLYQDMGDTTNALNFFTQSYTLGKRIHDPVVETTALNNLANLHLQTQSWQLSQEGFENALAIARQSGLKQYEVDNLDGLGQIYLALGQLTKAIESHSQALHIASTIGDIEGHIEALLNLGNDYLAAKEPQKALTVLHQAVGLSIPYPRATYTAHEYLSRAYEYLGEFEKSLQHYKAFHQLQNTLFTEDNKRKTRELSIQFEVERVHRQAEEYRLRTEIERQARAVAEQKVLERAQDLEKSQLEIVNRLALAGEYRDDDTGEHTRRVGRTSAILAHMLGWSKEDVQLIYSAARLHDVGKIGIRDAILLKPGKLIQDEMVIMKTHTTKGAGILSGGHSKLLKMAEEIARYHHERWDGSGYPHGLAGASIPQSARIVAVADVLDALTHERPYKKAWSVEDALAEIESLSGTHFDPLVVEMCLRVFRSHLFFSPLDTQNDWHTTYSDLHRLTTQSA
jgi:HD-GYP domain-containing protein (c-di-GMP phosphodiesterase class II)/predicted negative regulator of RcsB-dependent stress response